MGLYRVDPATLEPLPHLGPLTTGDWISGHVSSNGEWLALHVWLDTEPETDLVQVIDTGSGQIVSETSGRLADVIGVGDDGSVYQLSHLPSSGLRLRRLAAGDTGYETVFDQWPSEFLVLGSHTFLDSRRVAWLGSVGGDFEERVAAILVADLKTGTATTHLLDGVTVGEVGVTDLADWTVSETVTPAVAWDVARGRALVVHGDRDMVTVLDLETGEQEDHPWAETVSWLDRLMTWLVPPVQAKGPSSYGVSRSAIVDPTGERLYVGSAVAELVTEEENWFIEEVPAGVVVIDTRSWEIVDQLQVPVSEVALSPDGEFLVATGAAFRDSLATSNVDRASVHVFDTRSNELVGLFDPPGAWPQVKFSAEGGFMYLGSSAGQGTIAIVDLDLMVEVERKHGTLFAEAVLLATTRP